MNKEIQSSAEGAGKLKIILNFPALDFLVGKIKEREFQKSLCRSLPYFIYTYLLCFAALSYNVVVVPTLEKLLEYILCWANFILVFGKRVL